MSKAFVDEDVAALRLVFARDQLSSRELADRRFWNRLDEYIAARALEMG
jgi:outer membrane protein assembly factor BamD (BamD/ComL family)